MSRRDIPIKDGERRAVRAVVGYDRPLETFFAQVFETDADGEEDAFLWQGTFPGELPAPRSPSSSLSVTSLQTSLPRSRPTGSRRSPSRIRPARPKRNAS